MCLASINIIQENMMLDHIRNIISQYIKIDPQQITEDTELVEELGLNSYDLVSLIAAMEEEFEIVIPDRDILSFATVGDVMEYLEDNKPQYSEGN